MVNFSGLYQRDKMCSYHLLLEGHLTRAQHKRILKIINRSDPPEGEISYVMIKPFSLVGKSESEINDILSAIEDSDQYKKGLKGKGEEKEEAVVTQRKCCAKCGLPVVYRMTRN